MKLMETPSRSAFLGAPSRVAALDSLRACVTLLVIAHHAAIAYLPYAPPMGAFSGSDLSWEAFPVLDAARGTGLEILALWNESFFMGLMFLLSGLFVWPSLRRKGARRFARDRLVRLGIPFAVGALALAPLAYWPAYLQRANVSGSGGYAEAWLALGSWPSGPVWFLWVLLVFDCAAALLYRVAPGAGNWLARVGAWGRERPALLCICFAVVAAVAYLATTRVASPFSWWHWGPFLAQTARLPLYALYFVFGCALGTSGEIGGGLLAREGRLARRWVAWQAVAVVAFAGFVVALLSAFANGGRPPRALVLDLLASGTFAATGVATSFAMLALFARRFASGSAIMESLSRNAFGMYLIHYGIVSWIQYGLLPVSLPGLAKFAVVFAAAVGLSWAGAAALRRLPGAKEVGL